MTRCELVRLSIVKASHPRETSIREQEKRHRRGRTGQSGDSISPFQRKIGRRLGFGGDGEFKVGFVCTGDVTCFSRLFSYSLQSLCRTKKRKRQRKRRGQMILSIQSFAYLFQGNAAFKSGDYPTAIGHYTSAILADRNDFTFPLNRAAAYLKLGKYVFSIAAVFKV